MSSPPFDPGAITWPGVAVMLLLLGAIALWNWHEDVVDARRARAVRRHPATGQPLRRRCRVSARG